MLLVDENASIINQASKLLLLHETYVCPPCVIGGCFTFQVTTTPLPVQSNSLFISKLNVQQFENQNNLIDRQLNGLSF